MRLDRYRVRVACLAALLLVTTGLGVTQSSRIVACQDGCRTLAAGADLAAPDAAPPAPVPATVRVQPAAGAQNVLPVGPVQVTASSGTLTDVTMVNENGTAVAGIMTPDRTAWKPAVQLGYGRTYTMTVRSQGPGGMPAAETSSFTTVSPSYQTSVYLNTTGYASLKDGGTYGVGTVVVAHFDEPVTDKARAERQLVVTTSPAVKGSWNWVDEQNAHWRPERYYAPGTTVTVDANIYGVPLGDGYYGQDDEKVSFKIGDSHVSIADDNTKQVSVFDNGKLVRTMPTSMGRGGTETIGGTTLNFWTPPGVYTVLDKANPVIMDSSSYGLPTNSRLGYRETIPWATRISGDGIYLHQLNATVWAQGNTNTSHGCLNLSSENAKWFFDFAVPGDVVEIRHTGGPPQELLSQNGDWAVPWDQWRTGSALLS